MKHLASFLLVMLLPVAAWANPSPVEETFLFQVPGTRHVQLNELFVPERFERQQAPDALRRDGTRLDATWTVIAESARHTKSGQPMPGFQTCDCDVPIGQHSYDLVRIQEDFLFYLLPTPGVEVVDPAGSSGGSADAEDAAAWQVPLVGLDCRVACASGLPDAPVTRAADRDASAQTTDSVVALPVSPTTEGDTANQPPTTEPQAAKAAGGSGCSTPPRPNSDGGLLVLSWSAFWGIVRRGRRVRRVGRRPP